MTTALTYGEVKPHLELLKCAEKTGADLIVLGSHTKQTSGKWYAGSTVERVSYRADCPMIVINDPEVLLAWEDIEAPAKGPERPEADRFIHGFSRKSVT